MLRIATTAPVAGGRLHISRALRVTPLCFSFCLLLFYAAVGASTPAAAQSLDDDGCGMCDGQLDSLRVVYTGDVVTDITVDPQRGSSVIYQNVQPGDEIGIGPDTNGSNRLGSNTRFLIAQGDDVEFHTSCSEAIGPGVARGDIYISYASSRNEGYTCPTIDKTSSSHPDPFGDAAGPLNFSFGQESEVVTYQITLYNTGEQSLEVEDVTDELPSSPTTATYVSGSSSAGEPTISGQQLNFGTFTLSGFSSQVITYDVEIPNYQGSNAGEWENTVTGCFETNNGPACAQDTYLVFGGGNLPVELTSFDVILDGSDVALSWKTASETNNAGFYVEMAEAGVDKERSFEQLAFVDGHGTSVEAQNYSYRISTLEPGRYTFRLKQVDYDGASEYSPEVEVAVGLAEGVLVESVYPNPFRGQAQFRFAVQREQAVRAELYDVLGRRVQVLYEGRASEGQMVPVEIDGSDLANGLYLVRVAGERFTETRRVTLVR